MSPLPGPGDVAAALRPLALVAGPPAPPMRHAVLEPRGGRHQLRHAGGRATPARFRPGSPGGQAGGGAPGPARRAACHPGRQTSGTGRFDTGDRRRRTPPGAGRGNGRPRQRGVRDHPSHPAGKRHLPPGAGTSGRPATGAANRGLGPLRTGAGPGPGRLGLPAGGGAFGGHGGSGGPGVRGSAGRRRGGASGCRPTPATPQPGFGHPLHPRGYRQPPSPAGNGGDSRPDGHPAGAGARVAAGRGRGGRSGGRGGAAFRV